MTNKKLFKGEKPFKIKRRGEKMKVGIGLIIFTIIIIIAILGFTMRILADSNCERFCDERNAIISSTIPDRSFFSIHDYCICYYERDLEVKRL